MYKNIHHLTKKPSGEKYSWCLSLMLKNLQVVTFYWFLLANYSKKALQAYPCFLSDYLGYSLVNRFRKEVIDFPNFRQVIKINIFIEIRGFLTQ